MVFAVAPPLVPGPAGENVLRDVLHSERSEGLCCVLYDDSPGVRTVSVVVLDHLGEGLMRSDAVLLVRSGNEDLILRVGAQLGDDGPEAVDDVRLRLGSPLVSQLYLCGAELVHRPGQTDLTTPVQLWSLDRLD